MSNIRTKEERGLEIAHAHGALTDAQFDAKKAQLQATAEDPREAEAAAMTHASTGRTPRDYVRHIPHRH